jgi:hypothetical protein
MRTKTVLLSALLGALGGVSVHAQNVYSLNAVGYINVTLYPGLNIITVPLIASPDNTINTVLPNTNSVYPAGTTLWFYSPATLYSDAVAVPTTGRGSDPSGWNTGGTNVVAPGTAFWFQNFSGTNLSATFVGTVPTGPVTNSLVPGLNLVSSIVPISGDVVTNSISELTNYNLGDTVYTYNPNVPPYYTIYQSGSGRGFGSGYSNQWTGLGDPVIPFVGGGFFYENNSNIVVNWLENYSVAQ